MVAGLSGLSGLPQGYQQDINADAQATPEERSGGPADPRHGNWGEQAAPYPWESSLGMGGSHGPYGPENSLLGDEWWVYQPAGDVAEDPTFDHTPSTRSAPFPKGVASGPVPGDGPDYISEQLRQSANIHGVRNGAGLKALYPVQGLGVQQDEWQELWDVSPGHSEQQPLPKQAMSSGYQWGTTDRAQSMARQNGYGFDSAHKHRRYATGSIPGNTYWMRPGGRPLVKNIPTTARLPIGQNSPFSGDNPGANYSVNGAILMDTPTEYTPPPQPYVAPNNSVMYTGDDAPVEWF